MRHPFLSQRRKIGDIRYSRWGATNTSDFWRGYQSDVIIDYLLDDVTGGGSVQALDGVLNTLSSMTGTAGLIAAMAGLMEPLSGATGDAKADRGMAGAAAVLAGAEGAIAINNALAAALNTLSGMTGAVGLINGIGAQSDALSDMSGVIMTFTSFEGAIAAVSRMFELFRYLNPVSADSAITQGASYGSDILTAGAYASAMATAVDGYSAAATGETYLSIISTEVVA